MVMYIYKWTYAFRLWSIIFFTPTDININTQKLKYLHIRNYLMNANVLAYTSTHTLVQIEIFIYIPTYRHIYIYKYYTHRSFVSIFLQTSTEFFILLSCYFLYLWIYFLTLFQLPNLVYFYPYKCNQRRNCSKISKHWSSSLLDHDAIYIE